MTDRRDNLAEKLGYTFKDKSLLERALTHASVNSARSNERLEFLGDRILGLVIADKLYRLFPLEPEGALTLKFHALARKEACAAAAEAAGLPEFMILAAAEAASGGRRKAAILADVCEAVIAALYLDGGFDAARTFIERYWGPAIINLGTDLRDPKTMLQEWAHARRAVPAYTLVSREGPDHAPRFVVEVRIGEEDGAIGEGNSKREAEQAAAAALLARLERSAT